jgi:hypothetical protein
MLWRHTGPYRKDASRSLNREGAKKLKMVFEVKYFKYTLFVHTPLCANGGAG